MPELPLLHCVLQGVISGVELGVVPESPVTSEKEEGEFSDLDTSFVSTDSGDLLYIQTSQKKLRERCVRVRAPMPDRVLRIEAVGCFYSVVEFVSALCYTWLLRRSRPVFC